MKILIVIWEDRHCETTVHPFTTLEGASVWIDEQFKEYDWMKDREDMQLNQDMINDNWKLYIRYNGENQLRVVERELV